MSIYYKKITNPDAWVDEENTSTYLRKFNMLGVTQAFSILIASYNKYSLDDFNKITEHLTKFTFRYSTIAGANPNKPEALYGELSYSIYKEQLNAAGVIDKINDLWIDDNEFKSKFLKKDFKSTKIPRYILWEFEATLSTEEKDIVFEAVHLEHVKPKNIAKWSSDNSLYTKEFHSKNINKIGNMILLSQKINTSIKNSIFSEKKEAYDTSQINMVSLVKNMEVWDQGSIDSNAARYAQAALTTWSK